ncbi:MAG: PH domain-containing protein [Propionibacteriaceae bacterium]|jgi:hypothetical protein|nr:PH domain-containing protein [Propionibacteriaceae bacterium]
MSRPSLFSPQVERYLLADQGEFVIDEVAKHPLALVGPIAEALATIPLLFLVTVSGRFWWLFWLAALAALAHGAYRLHERLMDRFVITNMRVYRVHGVFRRDVATMPLARILDITVHQPWLGMVFDYGHFTFESAAQTQGLRDISFVGRPTERDLTIQRVIQQAGLRAEARLGDEPAETPMRRLADPDGT